MFTLQSLSPITEDDSVICSTEFSSIQPMENGEVRLVNIFSNKAFF